MYSQSVVDRLIGDLDKLQTESAEFHLCLDNIDELCNSDIFSNNDLETVLNKLEHHTVINGKCRNAYEEVVRLLRRELYWRTETLRLRQVLVNVFGMDQEQVYADYE